MSKKKESAFKNLGINKEMLFEKLGDVMLNINFAIEHISETLEEISEEHKIDPFDLECLQDNTKLCSLALVKLKKDLVCLYRIDGDVYEDLLYSIVKAANCLGNRTKALIGSHNAMVCHYSKEEVREVVVEEQPVDLDGQPIEPLVVPAPVVIAPRRRGRPPAKAKGVQVVVAPVEVTPRRVLDATAVDVEIEEIKINILTRVANRLPADITCEKCQVKMIPPVDEPGVVVCPVCNGIEYQEEITTDDGHVTHSTETKRKPGNDVKFYELINAIQGKLEVEEKLAATVQEAVEQAKANFRCGIDSYATLDKWIRNCRDNGGSGKKKYNKIYKYGPYIYAEVSGFELASLTDHEYDMIEAAYDIIYVNYRETNCKSVSGESGKSIKAEFYVEKLIDIYVKDFKRAKALKEVIPPRTSKSNSDHTIVWNKINSLGLLK